MLVVLPLAFLLWGSLIAEGRPTLAHFREALGNRLYVGALRNSLVPPGTVPGKIADVTFPGNLIDCHVTLDDATRVRVQAAAGSVLEVGQRVGVIFERGASTVFGA